MKRRYGARCSSCGGSAFVDAVDNHGQPYRGCASCRVLSLDEIDELLRAAPAPRRRSKR